MNYFRAIGAAVAVLALGFLLARTLSSGRSFPIAAAADCRANPADCNPPPPYQVQIQKKVTSPGPFKPGDEVEFLIQYQAQGDNRGISQLLCDTSGATNPFRQTGWVRITDRFPSAFQFVSSSLSYVSDCSGFSPQRGWLVWDAAALGATNTTQVQGAITVKLRIHPDLCAPGNFSTISINPDNTKTIVNGVTIEVFYINNPEKSSVASAPVNVVCPAGASAVQVTGNIAAAAPGAGVLSSSGLIIQSPSVITAGGQVTAKTATGATVVENYPIDLAQIKTFLDKNYQRLFRELAPACAENFNLTNDRVCQGGINYNVSGGSATAIFGSFGTGTVLLNSSNSNVVITATQANLDKSIGFMIMGQKTVYIVDSNYSGVAIYAPDSIVEFGYGPSLQPFNGPTSSSALDFKGVIIAREIKGLDKRQGTIQFDSSVVKSPPPGFRGLILPFLKEAIP